MIRVSRSIPPIRAALRDDDGAAAAWAVIWFIGCLALGGVAVDAANAFNMKTRLQSVADASALAAVMQIDDRDAARAAAISLAERNMPTSRNGNVIAASDVRFGVLDSNTGAFIEAADDEPAEVVRLVAVRTTERGNPLPTYLLRLLGPDSWDVGAAATAQTSSRALPPPPPTEDGSTCTAATIHSTGFIDTGGGNELGAGTCLYGEEGVQTGGNDCFEEGAHVISPDSDDITINYLRCGEEDDIVVEDTIEQKLLPKIYGGLFEEIYAAVNNAGKKWGDDETDEEIALLPAHFVGSRIIRVANMGWWTIQDSHLRENYIYLVNHGVQFAGGVDIENVAFIVNGQIGIGGGPSLKFDNVFLFGKGQLNFSGDVMWGSEGQYCEDGQYRVYLFSEQRLSLGGFGPATGAYGVMGAAPSFSPGGAMKNAGGLYIETEGWTSLGGAMELTGCDTPLASMYDAPTDGVSGDDATAGTDTPSDGASPGGSGAVLGASLVQ